MHESGKWEWTRILPWCATPPLNRLRHRAAPAAWQSPPRSVPGVARVVENGCPVSPGRRADGAGGSIFSGYHPGMRVDADHVEENRHQPLQVAELNHMAAGLLIGRPVEHRAGRRKVHANERLVADRERHPGAHELLHRLEQMRGVAIDMSADTGPRPGVPAPRSP